VYLHVAGLYHFHHGIASFIFCTKYPVDFFWGGGDTLNGRIPTQNASPHLSSFILEFLEF